MKNLLLLPGLAAALASPASATSIEGLRANLEANKDRYQEVGSKMKRMGLIPMDEMVDVRKDIAMLGEARKDAPPPAPAPAPAAPKRDALKEASRLAGGKPAEVADIPTESIAEFDPVTGERMAKSEGDMYQEIVSAIASQKCKAGSATGSFKSLLWGAVVLDVMSRDGKKWPGMVAESDQTWKQLVKAVAEGRKEFEKTGRVGGGAGGDLPTINYQDQKELAATASWDGNINVGDIFAGLSGPGKTAVLFHEYLHDTDDLTNAGLHTNYWSAKLPEPDNTPSGKNFTETLAYRNMGDWADVINLPWPKFQERR